jgi:hypothetical protein
MDLLTFSISPICTLSPKTNLSKISAAPPFFLLLLAAMAQIGGGRRSIKKYSTLVPVNNSNRD